MWQKNGCKKRRDEFIGRAIDLFSRMSDKDLYGLKIPSRFNSEPERKALLDELIAMGMPKASAWVMFIETARHGQEGVGGIVERLKELSGLEKLEDVLDRRFFSRGEIIRQCQTCRRIAATKAKFDSSVDEYLRQYENDSSAWNRLSEISLQDKALKDWVLSKRDAFTEDIASINEGVELIDRTFINSDISRLTKDAEARSWILGADIFSDAEKDAVTSFLDSFMGIGDMRSDNGSVKRVIEKVLLGIRNGSIPLRMKGLVQHLQRRLVNLERSVR